LSDHAARNHYLTQGISDHDYHAPVHGSTASRAQEARTVPGSLVTGAAHYAGGAQSREPGGARRPGGVDLAGLPAAAGATATDRACGLLAARSLRVGLC